MQRINSYSVGGLIDDQDFYQVGAAPGTAAPAFVNSQHLFDGNDDPSPRKYIKRLYFEISLTKISHWNIQPTGAPGPWYTSADTSQLTAPIPRHVKWALFIATNPSGPSEWIIQTANLTPYQPPLGALTQAFFSQEPPGDPTRPLLANGWLFENQDLIGHQIVSGLTSGATFSQATSSSHSHYSTEITFNPGIRFSADRQMILETFINNTGYCGHCKVDYSPDP